MALGFHCYSPVHGISLAALTIVILGTPASSRVVKCQGACTNIVAGVTTPILNPIVETTATCTLPTDVDNVAADSSLPDGTFLKLGALID